MNASVIRGIAALKEMLDCIGQSEDQGDSVVGCDHTVARILVGHEMELRALLFQVCSDLADATSGD